MSGKKFRFLMAVMLVLAAVLTACRLCKQLSVK